MELTIAYIVYIVALSEIANKYFFYSNAHLFLKEDSEGISKFKVRKWCDVSSQAEEKGNIFVTWLALQILECVFSTPDQNVEILPSTGVS